MESSKKRVKPICYSDADQMDLTAEEFDENSIDPPPKRQKTGHNDQVHDVSDDEIDVVDEIEDLVSAQNDNNATADETGEENPDGLDLLDNIAQDFDLDEQVGPNVHEKLVSIVNNSMLKKLNGEK